jgi:hypothetical protein
MADEDFLRRWSRRKQQASQAAAKANEAAPAAAAPAAPELPPLDSLTFESDFKEFMHSKVEESVKRAALKKLFQDPRFNVIDPLDIDIDDYSKLERLSEETVKTLEYAKRALFAEPKAPAEEAQQRTPEQEEKPAPQADANGSQDGNTGQDA